MGGLTLKGTVPVGCGPCGGIDRRELKGTVPVGCGPCGGIDRRELYL